jgi:hypothetical protein
MFNSFSSVFWLRLIAPLFFILGSASAQMGHPPAMFARNAGGKLTDQILNLKNSVVFLNTVAGMVYSIEYRGQPDDIQTAAWVMAVTLNHRAPTEVAQYVEIFTQNNRRSVTISGRSVDLELNWGTSLIYKIKPRLYRNFGQDRHQIGKSGVMIRQFTDYYCGPCRKFSLEVLPKLMAYVESGQATYSLRHFPLSEVTLTNNHPALAAECASAQGKFFEYHNAILVKGQDVIARAQELNLNMPDFQTCLHDQRTLHLITSETASAEANSVSGTPSVFVGPFQLPNAWDVDAYAGFIKMTLELRM